MNDVTERRWLDDQNFHHLNLLHGIDHLPMKKVGGYFNSNYWIFAFSLQRSNTRKASFNTSSLISSISYEQEKDFTIKFKACFS
tara:strand:+ start:129 stop:380 length:252 start_codon:yes stop_codon:yes gene_type:complete